MKRDLGQLRVQKLIVHDVPHRFVSMREGAPILSEIDSPLTQTVKNFFKERITGTLGSSAFDVDFDPETASPLPDLIYDNLGDRKKSFVSMSQDMAHHLYSSQGGNNPGGLLTVAQGTIEGTRALAILKLEKDEGVRVEQGIANGQRTFSIEHIQDLMLTGRTRVFKAGLFVQEGDSLATVEGIVCDTQGGYIRTTVANFFLRRFLGCRLKERSDITTKRFFESCESFINDQITNPELKARYQVAVLAELNANRLTVTPRTFARENLESHHQQIFLTHLENATLPDRRFEKDNQLIRIHLNRIQFAFQSGVQVFASPEHLNNQLTIEELKNGQTKLEITDHLKDVGGRR